MKQKICKPDYKRCLVNLSNSILKYYGLPQKHSSLPELDEMLDKKKYRNVVLLQMDGMGVDMLEHNLPADSFLRAHIKSTITSVYPSTTAAATTSTYSGMTPLEHGFAGWQCYFEEYDSHVILFRNFDFYTGKPLGFNVTSEHMPYKMLYEQIRDSGNAKAYGVSKPWGDFHVESFDELCAKLEELAREKEPKFIMSYWINPDGYMHKTGCYSAVTRKAMTEFDAGLRNLSAKLEDTLLIITADHGLLDIGKSIRLDKIPELNECLRLAPGLEPRANAFYIKPEFMDVFPKRFNKLLGEEFILLTAEDYIREGYAGEGNEHPGFREFLGDYMALGIGDTIIQYEVPGGLEAVNYFGHHAGLSEKEMLIPLIIYEC